MFKISKDQNCKITKEIIKKKLYLHFWYRFVVQVYKNSGKIVVTRTNTANDDNDVEAYNDVARSKAKKRFNRPAYTYT